MRDISESLAGVICNTKCVTMFIQTKNNSNLCVHIYHLKSKIDFPTLGYYFFYKNEIRKVFNNIWETGEFPPSRREATN